MSLFLTGILSARYCQKIFSKAGGWRVGWEKKVKMGVAI